MDTYTEIDASTIAIKRDHFICRWKQKYKSMPGSSLRPFCADKRRRIAKSLLG